VAGIKGGQGNGGDSGCAVEFGVLGEVTAHVAGRPVELGPRRQRLVLAALLVDANRVVSMEQLVRRVWDDAPPQRARAGLNSYVSRLRQAVGDSLVWRSGGYMLVVERSAADLHRFADLCERARPADNAEAVTLLTEALGLWRGEALAGLESSWAVGERHRLHQQRLLAQHELVDARLRLGHGEELVAELSARAADHPLDERVAGQYLLALYRSGRTADALEHYQRVRTRLAEELGTDPGVALQELHQRILRADPTLTAAERPRPAAVPRQLPAPPAPFAGRDAELAELTKLDSGPVVIAGGGGIGKTWLALHWAHRQADRFPDGQLFVDLRGFSPDGEPLDPLTVLRGFLDALGHDPAGVTGGLAEHTALYRSLTADKRMLVVLDNAATDDQVEPLVPGSPTCTTVITSRRRLSTLATRHGAHAVTLAVLDEEEARTLLVRRLGENHPESVLRELVARCARYPLALAIVASRAQAHPDIPLAEFTAELRDLGLEALDDDDPGASLPAVLSWSLRRLTAEQRTTFALVGLAPGPDISLAAAARLVGLRPAHMRRVLHSLADASLLDRRAGDRYSMHDLVRDYASRQDPTEDVRDAAVRRVVDFYRDTAHRADRLVAPQRPLGRLPQPSTADPHELPDVQAALDWLDAEHANLIAAQHAAAGRGWHETAWQLAWSLTIVHLRRGQLHDQLVVWRGAAHILDPVALAIAHRHLGRVHAELGDHEEGMGHLNEALALTELHGELAEQAHTHRVLARAWNLQGDQCRALDHATRAFTLYHRLDQPIWEADALNQMGWHAASLGDDDAARAHCEAALDLHQRHDNAEGAANALDSLGYIAHRVGSHAEAIRRYQQALALYRSLGNTYDYVNTVDRLGHPHAALGEAAQARAAWQEAMALYQSQGRHLPAGRLRQLLDALAADEQASRAR